VLGKGYLKEPTYLRWAYKQQLKADEPSGAGQNNP